MTNRRFLIYPNTVAFFQFLLYRPQYLKFRKVPQVRNSQRLGYLSDISAVSSLVHSRGKLPTSLPILDIS